MPICYVDQNIDKELETRKEAAGMLFYKVVSWYWILASWWEFSSWK